MKKSDLNNLELMIYHLKKIKKFKTDLKALEFIQYQNTIHSNKGF